jgi:hypothetical protein
MPAIGFVEDSKFQIIEKEFFVFVCLSVGLFVCLFVFANIWETPIKKPAKINKLKAETL